MSLDVHLDGRRIGSLERATGTDYVFAYAPELLAEAGEGAIVLSNSLPVRTEAFGPIETRAFFDGLLPEESRRNEIARELRVDAGDGYALLAEIGRDCAGAVVIVPAGTGVKTGEGSVSWLREETLEELVERLLPQPGNRALASLHAGARGDDDDRPGAVAPDLGEQCVAVAGVDPQLPRDLVATRLLRQEAVEEGPGLDRPEGLGADRKRVTEDDRALSGLGEKLRRIGKDVVRPGCPLERADPPPVEVNIKAHRVSGRSGRQARSRFSVARRRPTAASTRVSMSSRTVGLPFSIAKTVRGLTLACLLYTSPSPRD